MQTLNIVVSSWKYKNENCTPLEIDLKCGIRVGTLQTLVIKIHKVQEVCKYYKFKMKESLAIGPCAFLE